MIYHVEGCGQYVYFTNLISKIYLFEVVCSFISLIDEDVLTINSSQKKL